MKNSKMRYLIPVMLMVVASAASLANVTEKLQKKQPSVQGWKRISPFNCVPVKLCNNIDMMLCMDGGSQLYGKSSPVGDCTLILFHKP